MPDSEQEPEDAMPFIPARIDANLHERLKSIQVLTRQCRRFSQQPDHLSYLLDAIEKDVEVALSLTGVKP